MDQEIFKDFSYGMFVISTNYNGKDVGCFVNTCVQITNSEPVLAISINKNNFTNKAIKQTKKLAISILSEETNPDVIGKFGFYTSEKVNKFETFNILRESSLPIVNENMCGYLICELVEVVNVNTHDVFLVKVIETKKLNNFVPMTYSYYHKVIKGKAPKTAPTYANENLNNSKSKKYKCLICGYIYDDSVEKVKFEDLPKNWKCPICGVGKENFVLLD